MKVYALSDLHVDYAQNREWLQTLVAGSFGEDVLILAGDISDKVNQTVEVDDILFVNNAFAYPDEERIARKHLYCVWENRL